VRQKVILTWSGGKDSALALFELSRSKEYQITALLTTLTRDYDRVSMHGVRRILLEQQAESIGIPLEKVFISEDSSNEEYESNMREVLEKYVATGVGAVAFGDIFLEDVRRHRENNLSKIGVRAIFPLWRRDTFKLAREFVNSGFKAVITCVDSTALDKMFVGRDFDEGLLSELPSTVDPCGENGEFHCFVYDGPIFRQAISVTRGEVVLREKRFYYRDLIPTHSHRPTGAV
jgi:uncharacterized protein (TIGR00290 family)